MPAKVLRNVMLDLETTGREKGCVVLSIGACKFGGGKVADKFYRVVNRKAQEKIGMTTNPSTMEWWARQSAEARQVLKDASSAKSSAQPDAALVEFTEWLGAAAIVWGNGSDFDQPILAGLYHACRMNEPWEFYNSRCYRTFKSFAPSLKIARGGGTHHNALDDAVAQARHAMAVAKELGLKVFD